MSDQALTQEQKRRKVALSGMRQYAEAYGVTDREWREEDRGEAVYFIGATPDGREFSLGYEKVQA